MKTAYLLVLVTCATVTEIVAKESNSLLRVIAEVDVGADDAFGLNILLHAEKLGHVKLEAIVCTVGNSDVNNVCKNVVRVLEILNRTDIPIYKGAYRSIVQPPADFSRQFFFGKDGFGDLNFTSEPDLSVIEEVPAPIALYELVTKNPGEITLLCLSPPTTTALTVLLYKDFVCKLKQIWIMGGNYKANETIMEETEFNFYSDPESVNVLLQSCNLPLYIFPWETCVDVGLTSNWRFDVLGKQQSQFVDVLNKVERNLGFNESSECAWNACDAFATMAVIYPDIILKQSSQHASIDLHGRESRGRLFYYNKDSEKRVNIIEKVDAQAVKTILLTSANY